MSYVPTKRELISTILDFCPVSASLFSAEQHEKVKAALENLYVDGICDEGLSQKNVRGGRGKKCDRCKASDKHYASYTVARRGGEWVDT